MLTGCPELFWRPKWTHLLSCFVSRLYENSTCQLVFVSVNFTSIKMRRLVQLVFVVGSVVLVTPQYSYLPANSYSTLGQSYYSPDPLLSSQSISQNTFFPSNSLTYSQPPPQAIHQSVPLGSGGGRFRAPIYQQQSSSPGINSLFERVIEEASVFVENGEVEIAVNQSAHHGENIFCLEILCKSN